MRLLPLLCTLALASAALLPAVRAAWVTEFDQSDCTSPLNSVGNVPTGECTRICSNGGCWGSQFITCDAESIGVNRFYSNDCTGTPFSTANSTVDAPTADTCLTVFEGTHTYKVSCQEPAEEQSRRVKTEYFSDPTCSTPIYGTQGPDYAFSNVGTCFKTSDSPAQSEGTYCSADGSAVHAYTFDGADCNTDSWKSVRHYEAGKCEATYSATGKNTVYTKMSCPGAGNRGPAPPVAWPPAGAAIGFVCATGDCSSGCTARVANRLGFCFAFDGQGSSCRMGCTADGGSRGLAVHSDSQCNSPMTQTFLEPTRGGPAMCNGRGEYNTCPSQVASTSPKAVFEIPDAVIWEAQFKHEVCKSADFSHATLYVPGACIYHQFTVEVAAKEDGSGNEIQWTLWDGPECTGNGNIVRNIAIDSCQNQHGDGYASTSWSSSAHPSDETFELPPASEPTTGNPTDGSTSAGEQPVEEEPVGGASTAPNGGLSSSTGPTGAEPNDDNELRTGAASATAQVSMMVILLAFIAQQFTRQ